MPRGASAPLSFTGSGSRPSAVVVPVVQVRIVRMLVAHWFVAVPMGMRFGHRTVVHMLVMVVMHVGMFVFERVVGMVMLVPFGEM
jgi:hypothetical protein